MPSTKPTKEFIEKRAAKLQGLWQDAHDDWETIDAYYHQTNPLWPSEVDRTELHSARAPAIVDTAVDNFLSGEPRVHRPPAGSGRTHKEKADRIEKWMKAIMVEAALLEPIPAWKQIAKNMVLYGYAVLKGPMLSLQDRPVKPKKEAGESKEDFTSRESLWQNENRTWMPFRFRAPHPARVLMDPREKTPPEAIEVTNQFAHELQALTEKKVSQGKMDAIFDADDKPWENIATTEYWSKDWHALIANNKLLFAERNTWGFVPYSHAFAGWGQEKTDATELNPDELAKGILWKLRDDLKAQGQSMSALQNALVTAAYQKYGTTHDAAEIANQMQGDVVDGLRGKDKDIWVIDVPQIPAWLFQVSALQDQDIEMGSFSRALAGVHDAGVSTVGQQAILSTAAAKKFVTPSQQIEQMATILGKRILRLVDVLNEPLQINEWKIGPKDLDHDYSVQIRFELIDPILSLEQRQLGMAEVAQGLKSRRTYWSADAKLEDATGEADRILLESVENDPNVIAILAQAVAKRDGISGLLEQLEMGSFGESENAPAIVDQNGNPLSSQGAGAPNTGVARAELRQGLTPSTAKPPRVQPGQATGGIV